MRLAADRRQAPPVIRIRQRVPVPILHDEASIVVVFDGPGLGINLKLVCIGTTRQTGAAIFPKIKPTLR